MRTIWTIAAEPQSKQFNRRERRAQRWEYSLCGLCDLCGAIVQVARTLRGFLVPTQKTDRIMAGQNHTEQRQNHCSQDHKKRGFMILSCHDSVFFLMVAAWPRCVLRASAVKLLRPRSCSKCAVPGYCTAEVRRDSPRILLLGIPPPVLRGSTAEGGRSSAPHAEDRRNHNRKERREHRENTVPLCDLCVLCG